MVNDQAVLEVWGEKPEDFGVFVLHFCLFKVLADLQN